MNWNGIWNRLWRLLDMPAPCYFSGPRFLNVVREIDFNLPTYADVIDARNRNGQSTSRRDYFRDTLVGLDEGGRVRLVVAILDEIHACDEALTAEIRALLAGGVASPVGNVPAELWAIA